MVEGQNANCHSMLLRNLKLSEALYSGLMVCDDEKSKCVKCKGIFGMCVEVAQ